MRICTKISEKSTELFLSIALDYFRKTSLSSLKIQAVT